METTWVGLAETVGAGERQRPFSGRQRGLEERRRLVRSGVKVTAAQVLADRTATRHDRLLASSCPSVCQNASFSKHRKPRVHWLIAHYLLLRT